ncbi:NAD(+)/NADH kinase [Nocardioides aestuarii]|uniref:Inorganic polyphosphate kinase n=1 Tax=Nocardioides aestuarii TaxID=252231 RepID=A0ABW4TMC8_9ACTN
MTLQPRAVVVHRTSELDALVARHGTTGQAAFFLESRGRDLAGVAASHAALERALASVAADIPAEWRRVRVEREDLPRFAFEPGDVVVAVGQDGLVANVAKYLSGQPVIGVDPAPGEHPGVLVRHRAEAVGALLSRHPGLPTDSLAMVTAWSDDGQRLTGLNEVFVGHASHQSARYTLAGGDGWRERQSSSGLLVGTGTGATGWCLSVARERRAPARLPERSSRDLAWFVREAWRSPSTGADHTGGELAPGDLLGVRAESDLVVFADGMEGDALHLTWGQELTVGVADGALHLVT